MYVLEGIPSPADVDDVMPQDAEDNHVVTTLNSSTESPHEVQLIKHCSKINLVLVI